MNENNHNPLQKSLMIVKTCLIADDESLYGKAYVTEELKRDAKITASILTGANLTDFFLSQSTFNFAFAGMGWLGMFLALGVNWGFLVLKNKGGELTCRKREGSRGLRAAGFFTLVSLSAVSSITSGIGAELTNNQSGLVQNKAEQIIEKQKFDLASRSKPVLARLNEAKRNLEDKNKERINLPKDHPMYDPLTLLIDGSYQQRHGGKNKSPTVNWDDFAEKDLPLDQLVKRLEKAKDAEEKTISGDWEKKLAKRAEIGNNLLFLKQEMPNQYDQYFKNDEEFRSGTDAIAVASDHFFSNLKKGDFSKIAMSLFFASLSIVTSIAACVLVVVFANNKDAQMSWSEAVRDAWDEYLDKMSNPDRKTEPPITGQDSRTLVSSDDLEVGST